MASPLIIVDVSTEDGQSLTHSSVLGWEISLCLPNSLIAILTVQPGIWSQGSTNDLAE